MNSLAIIIWETKSRRMRGAGHVAIWGGGDVYTGFWWGDPRDRDRWEDLGVDGRIIFKCNFKKQDW